MIVKKKDIPKKKISNYLIKPIPKISHIFYTFFFFCMQLITFFSFLNITETTNQSNMYIYKLQKQNFFLYIPVVGAKDVGFEMRAGPVGNGPTAVGEYM